MVMYLVQTKEIYDFSSLKCSHMRYTEKQNTNTNNLQRDMIVLAKFQSNV